MLQHQSYAAMRKKVADMQEAHTFIPEVMDNDKAITLTAEEYRILIQYLGLIREIEDLERRQIYFRGHLDCFAYLKWIGVIEGLYYMNSLLSMTLERASAAFMLKDSGFWYIIDNKL